MLRQLQAMRMLRRRLEAPGRRHDGKFIFARSSIGSSGERSGHER